MIEAEFGIEQLQDIESGWSESLQRLQNAENPVLPLPN